jgi:nitrite reductase/ring-hydroxylating ferredoxin subunit
MSAEAPPLCRLDEIADNAARGFDPEGGGQDTLFAVRRGPKLYLYRDRCPHASTPMAWRKDGYLNRRGDRIVCFAHGAQFEVETGRCLLGPCLGQSLEAVAHDIDEQGRVRLV